VPELTIGTVTSRCTDIQSSTRLLQLAGGLQAALPSLPPSFVRQPQTANTCASRLTQTQSAMTAKAKKLR
jgi:hypothetical protein